MLFRDANGHILLVNPSYKPDWDLPGGTAEANESPLAAAIRKVGEKLSIQYTGGRLLVVDWVPPHGPWDDSLMFIFDGGLISAEQQAAIRIVDAEIEDAQFFPPGEAEGLLRPYVCGRVQAAFVVLCNGAAILLGDGYHTYH